MPYPPIGGGRSGNSGNREICERLARIEERQQHMATKAWVLGGVVGGLIIGMTLASTVTLILMRVFASP